MATDWRISILAMCVSDCRISILLVQTYAQGPLWYRMAVLLFDRGHPCFRNFDSIVPVDVVRVKSYVDSLFNPTGVPV